MARWINADTKRTVMVYDDEHEEFISKKMTIEEMCHAFTEEGIPIIFSGLEKNKWILCSERLPEKWGDYLVSMKWRGVVSGEVYTETSMATYNKRAKEWDRPDVIAWMPLPAPLELEELRFH